MTLYSLCPWRRQYGWRAIQKCISIACSLSKSPESQQSSAKLHTLEAAIQQSFTIGGGGVSGHWLDIGKFTTVYLYTLSTYPLCIDTKVKFPFNLNKIVIKQRLNKKKSQTYAYTQGCVLWVHPTHSAISTGPHCCGTGRPDCSNNTDPPTTVLIVLYFRPPTGTGLHYLQLLLYCHNHRNSTEGFGRFVYNANLRGNQTGKKYDALF